MMHKVLGFVALLLAVLVASAAASNVVELTPDNFDTVVDGSKTVFVEFFAPWCGHCKTLAPVWEQLADSFVAQKGKVVIAKVDANEHKALGSRFDVKGFPTLKIFKAGKKDEPQAYNGGRDVDSLTTFVETEVGVKSKRPAKPASHVVVLTKSNFDEEIIKDTKSGALVEFYAPWCGHCKRLEPEFDKLARAFKTEPSVKIAKIDCDAHGDVCSKYGVSGYPTLKWFTADAKDEPTNFEGGRTLEELVKSVNEKFGLSRSATGQPGITYGRIAALDSLVANYVARTKEEKDALVDKVKSAIAEIKDEVESKAAQLYSKVLELLQKKPDYLTTETARLTKMVENAASYQPAKLDEFHARLNVLKAFQAAVDDE